MLSCSTSKCVFTIWARLFSLKLHTNNSCSKLQLRVNRQVYALTQAGPNNVLHLSIYHISSIRRHGYYLFCCKSLCGYYSKHLFLWKACWHQQQLDKVIQAIQWQLLDAVNSKHSLSTQLEAVEMSHTTWKSPNARLANIGRNYLHPCVCRI